MIAKKPYLSVVLATFNEEENIKECLLSIKKLADEIIVVDGNSSDKTAVIAKKMGAKVYVVPNQMMFHQNKQLALSKATGEWILQLDADERVTPQLAQEIKKEISKKNNSFDGYFLPRKNYFLTKFLTKGGQYPDYVIRLVKNGKAYFPCQSVHEQIKVEGKVGFLKNDLIHWANPNLSKYLRNADRYTTLTAIALKKNKVALNFFNQFKYLFWLPMKTFFNIFFRHRGFQDGVPGFVFAFFSGLHYFIAFVKYWEKQKKSNKNFNLKKDWQ